MLISGCFTYLCCVYTKMCLIWLALVLADFLIPVPHIITLSIKITFELPEFENQADICPIKTLRMKVLTSWIS